MIKFTKQEEGEYANGWKYTRFNGRVGVFDVWVTYCNGEFEGGFNKYVCTKKYKSGDEVYRALVSRIRQKLKHALKELEKF